MRLDVRLGLVVAAVALGLSAGGANAQDHEKCYKIKDPAKIKGIVDLTTPQFGLEPGCKLGPAKYFCAPAFKIPISVTSNGAPIVPLPVYAAPAPGDRICYKVKCPLPPPPFPPDQNVTDQFGNRTLSKFKAAYMCTPAVKGPGYCGNGIVDPGEACDFPAVAGCTIGCQPDCTCTCETACCYVENVVAPTSAECFEYTGTPAQVATFQRDCTNGVPPPAVGVPAALPPVAMANSNVGLPGLVAAPCAANVSPLLLVPCLPGPPGAGNLHVIPADSSCP